MRQAVILVGGRGTRLGALAQDTPKPLLPISGDVRFLDYLLDNIARHGVKEIILLAGHLGEQVEARYAGRSIRGARVSVVREPEPAGTAGALTYIANRLDDIFLMSNGDSFFDVNYLALNTAMAPGDLGALALRRVDDASRFGRVSLQDGRITGFHEKDAGWKGPALISGGVYVLKREVLGLVGKPPASIETDLFPRLVADGRIAGVTSEGFFIDIGLPETLAQGRDELPAQLRRGAVFFDRDGTLNVDGGYTHKPEALEFIPGAIDAIRAANDAGALAIVVTNQAGIARGLYDEAQMHAFHAHMQARLREHGAHIDAFYHCPFHAEGVAPEFTRNNHPDRKPAPGMLKRAMIEWPIDPTRSFLVGDHEYDLTAAAAANLLSYKVAPGEVQSVVSAGLTRMKSTQTRHTDDVAALKDRAAKAKAWLFDAALPFWWNTGFDRSARCFHEKVDADGQPMAGPRRVRVQARQTFVYAAAGKLGWNGPWRDAANAGVDVLMRHALRADGGTRHLLDDVGQPLDDRRDLYDIAFVIFALAHAGIALERSDLADAGAALADWTFNTWAHPQGGLREGEVTPTPPRRQNPHMHMLEALLALYEATNDERHLRRAREIVVLLRTKFVHPRWGALLEYFNDDWSPCPSEEGRIAEPGHQFEWTWLLDRYRRLSGDSAADIAERLHAHGEVYGVNAAGYTVDETWAEGGVRTASSRLWPHTERIKANVVRFENGASPIAAAAAIQAYDTLSNYLDPRGFWRDRCSGDGAFEIEPAPASSQYHIVMAFVELIRVAEAL